METNSISEQVGSSARRIQLNNSKVLSSLRNSSLSTDATILDSVSLSNADGAIRNLSFEDFIKELKKDGFDHGHLKRMYDSIPKDIISEVDIGNLINIVTECTCGLDARNFIIDCILKDLHHIGRQLNLDLYKVFVGEKYSANMTQDRILIFSENSILDCVNKIIAGPFTAIDRRTTERTITFCKLVIGFQNIAQEIKFSIADYLLKSCAEQRFSEAFIQHKISNISFVNYLVLNRLVNQELGNLLTKVSVQEISKYIISLKGAELSTEQIKFLQDIVKTQRDNIATHSAVLILDGAVSRGQKIDCKSISSYLLNYYLDQYRTSAAAKRLLKHVGQNSDETFLYNLSKCLPSSSVDKDSAISEIIEYSLRDRELSSTSVVAQLIMSLLDKHKISNGACQKNIISALGHLFDRVPVPSEALPTNMKSCIDYEDVSTDIDDRSVIDHVYRHLAPIDESEIEKFVDKLFKQALVEFPTESIYALSKILRYIPGGISQQKFNVLIEFFQSSDIGDKSRLSCIDAIDYAIQNNPSLSVGGLSKCLGYGHDDRVLDVIEARGLSSFVTDIIPPILKRISADSASAAKVVSILEKIGCSEESKQFLNQVALLNNDNAIAERALSLIRSFSDLQSVKLDKLINEGDLNSIFEYCRENTASKNCFDFILQNLSDAVPILQVIVERNKQALPESIVSALVEMLPALKSDALDLMNKIIRQGKSSLPKDIMSKVLDGIERGNYQLIILLDSLLSQNKGYAKSVSERYTAVICRVARERLYSSESISVLERISQSGICINKKALEDLAGLDLDPNVLARLSTIIQRNYYLSQNASRVTNSYSKASALDDSDIDLGINDSVQLIKYRQEIVNARSQEDLNNALHDVKTILERKRDLPDYIIECLYDVIASNSDETVIIAQDILKSLLQFNSEKSDLDLDKILSSQHIDDTFIEILAILATRGNINIGSLSILLYYSTFSDLEAKCSSAIDQIPSGLEIYRFVDQYRKLLESNNELESLEDWSKQGFYIGRNGVILLEKICVDPRYATPEHANRVFSILQENGIFNVSEKLYNYLQSYVPKELGEDVVSLEQSKGGQFTEIDADFDEHFVALVEKLKQIRHLSGDKLIAVAKTLKSWEDATVDTFIDLYSENSVNNLLLVKNLEGIEDELIQQSFYELDSDSNDVGDLVKAASRMSMRVNYCEILSLTHIDRLVDLGYSYKDIEFIRAKSGEQFGKVIASIVDYGVFAKDTNYKNQTLLDIVTSCEGDSILRSAIEMALEVGFKGSLEKDLDTLLKEIKQNDETIDVEDLRNKYDQIIYCHNTQDSILHPIGKTIKDWSKEDIRAWSAAVRGNPATKEHLTELIAVIKRANIVAEGKDPRATQILSTLLMYQNSRSTLLQIATGEGKTTIVAMLAAAKVLQGEKVDVITSSSILATDGAVKKQDFYGTLGLSVGDNASDKKSCYGKDIVYGSLDNFQYDFLKDEYKLEGIRQKRPFSTVIVDEVDSMLVDEGSKIAMLSENIAGMEYLEFMLATIFMTTIRFVKGFTGERDPQTGDLVFCDPAANPDEEPAVLLVSDTMEFVKSNVKQAIQDRYFSSKASAEREEGFIMPANLKIYAEKQLDNWIEMSILATQQHEKVDYIIKDGEIKPIDKNNTGIVQTNMSWQNGLHQFLQIKHGLRISPESFTTCFVSNVSYFKRYGNNIYGMTGTLGSAESKKLLSEVYNVSCASVPTYRQKQFIELTPIIAHEESHWINEIVASTRNALDQNRAVLIICRSMEDVDSIEHCLQALGSIDSSKIQKYSDNTSDKGIDGEKITSGRVIIATNLAGRGTDINADEIEPYGGLHVCLTFLPSNLRVEEQALGRTARQGKKGTGQLIIKSSIDDINEIKHLRDEGEKERLEKIGREELKTILIKDKLFLENFMSFVVKMRKASKDKNVIKAIEERWGLFLSTLDLDKDSDESVILAKYNDFIKGITGIESDLRNGCYHTLIGNDLCDREKYAEAISSYDSAIRLDPALEYIAHYNKAFAIIKKSGDADAAKTELDAALKIIDDSMIPQLDGLGAIALMCYNHFSDNPKQSQAEQEEIQTALQAQIIAKKDLLEQHKAYISQALDIIKNKKKDSTIEIAETKCLEDICEDKSSMKEVGELRNHGLRHLFVIREKPPVNIWGIIGVFLLGALQIIGGAALTLVGFANVGMGLIGEGVGDLITGIRSAISGEFDWMQYLKDKAISIAISVVMMGCSAIKNAVKAAGSIKGAIKAGIEGAKEVGKKAIAKLTGKGVQSAVLNEAAKQVGKEATKTLTKEGMKAVGKVVLKEFVEQGAIELINYGVGAAIQAAIDQWQEQIAARVRGELHAKLDKHSISSVPAATADQIANSFINKRDGILQEFGSRFAMVAGKHLVARKGGWAAVAANVGAATIVSAMGWVEQDRYTAKFCAEINEKVGRISSQNTQSKQKTEGEQKSAALVAGTADSLIENWAQQITDKIKSIIKNQMVSPWTNLAVAQGVKQASNHVQRSFSSQGHTFDEKLNIWQAKRSQYVSAQKIAAGKGSNAPVRSRGQEPDGNREMDMHDVAIIARNENATIIVRDENGKPIGVFGNGAKTVELERTPARDGASGHFKLKGMDGDITPSGPNMCGFDSIGHALGKDPHALKASANSSKATDDNKYARNIRSAQEALGRLHKNSDKAKNAMMMGGVDPDRIRRDPESKHPRDVILTVYRGDKDIDPNKPITAKAPNANISELDHLADTVSNTQFISTTTNESIAKGYAGKGGKVVTMEIPARIDSDESYSFREDGSIKTQAKNISISGRPGYYQVYDCTNPQYFKERIPKSELYRQFFRKISKGSSIFIKDKTWSQVVNGAANNQEVLITGSIMPSEIKSVSELV
jgi:preprotein translocase subunit SecA